MYWAEIWMQLSQPIYSRLRNSEPEDRAWKTKSRRTITSGHFYIIFFSRTYSVQCRAEISFAYKSVLLVINIKARKWKNRHSISSNTYRNMQPPHRMLYIYSEIFFADPSVLQLQLLFLSSVLSWRWYSWDTQLPTIYGTYRTFSAIIVLYHSLKWH